jgi:hypothetical protein
MKLLIVSACLLSIIFSFCNKTEKKIECILIERPVSITGCGILSFTYAMKFQKINNKTEFIGFLFCPDFYGRDFFQAGQKYHVIITDTANITKADIIVNKYKDENLPYYGIKEMGLIK